MNIGFFTSIFIKNVGLLFTYNVIFCPDRDNTRKPWANTSDGQGCKKF